VLEIYAPWTAGAASRIVPRPAATEEEPMPRKSEPPPRKHAVHARLNIPQLAKAGYSLDLEIYAEGEKIGTLIIGRGSLFWRGGKRKGQKQIDWTRFAQIMDEMVYGPES
jgi:hypothetical protein